MTSGSNIVSHNLEGVKVAVYASNLCEYLRLMMHADASDIPLEFLHSPDHTRRLYSQKAWKLQTAVTAIAVYEE